jgi:hypothetical protein
VSIFRVGLSPKFSPKKKLSKKEDKSKESEKEQEKDSEKEKERLPERKGRSRTQLHAGKDPILRKDITNWKEGSLHRHGSKEMTFAGSKFENSKFESSKFDNSKLDGSKWTIPENIFQPTRTMSDVV